jgi:hypothetical protein
METTEKRPENYLVHSILATIFCCWPLGIPAIIYASKVNTKFAEGDYEAARDASRKAKNWSIWSAIVAIIVIVLYLLFFGFALFSTMRY